MKLNFITRYFTLRSFANIYNSAAVFFNVFKIQRPHIVRYIIYRYFFFALTVCTDFAKTYPLPTFRNIKRLLVLRNFR